MASVTTEWILELKQNLTGQLSEIDKQLNGASNSSEGFTGNLKKMTAIDLYAIANSFDAINNSLQRALEPGRKFEAGLKEVEAITGVTGSALDSLGDKARKSAKTFGGDAADSLNTYKVFLSKLGPDIAQSEEALAGMENNARILSKTMNNDLAGATDALSTAMLQYKVDLADPIAAQEEMTNMMNVMAAGAKFGSAEITQISQAIRVSGVAAKQANVTFVETNAALQELARGGKEGSEAGVALRNVLGKMAGEDVIPKAAVDKLRALGVDMSIVSNTALPFTTRLRELKKAQADATVIAQVFGTENAAAANILLDSVAAQEELQTKLVNTNTAYEQAAIIMDGDAEKMSRRIAFVKDLGISFFDLGKHIAPGVSVVANLGMAYANTANVMKAFNLAQLVSIKNTVADSIAKNGLIGSLKIATLATWGFVKSKVAEGFQFIKNIGLLGVGAVAALGSYITAVVSATASQLGLNAVMSANPIGLLIKGIAAAIAVIVVIIKYWDQFGASIALVGGIIALFFAPAIAGFMALISIFMSLRRHWDMIKEAFTEGGILAGIKAIGVAILDAILQPMQQLLEIVAKIPGMGDLAQGGADKIAKLRESLTGSVQVDINKGKMAGFKNESEERKKNSGTASNSAALDEVLGTAPVTGNAETTANAASGISGTGSGGAGKSITMTLDIKNYFNVDSTFNLDDIAEQIVGKINDKLRDATVALG